MNSRSRLGKSLLALSGALLTVFSVTLSAQTFSGPGFTIVDGGGRTSPSCSIIPVSGLTSAVSVRSVTYSGFSHSWLGDTELRVYPPGSAPPPSTAGSVVMSSPPDGRSCNFAGNYRFIDSASQSVDAATVGCSDATNLPPGDYRTSTYGGGTNPGPVTSLSTAFGVLSPAQANGNWLACAFDFATPDGGTVSGTSITFATLTAAPVYIMGRVSTPGGRGIPRAVVKLDDGDGTTKSAMTNSFGYYRFENIPAGRSYILSVTDRLYRFSPSSLLHTANDNAANVDFISVQ